LEKIRHHLGGRGWRQLHSGVYLLTSSAPTRRQRWFGAVLTAPGTVLSHGSAGACYGFYRFERGYEVVTRPGQGGRGRYGGVLAFRSKRLEGDVTFHQRIPITTAARVLVDIAPGLNDKQLGRAFRESIRLKCTSARRVLETVERHQGRPGTPRLRALATRYATIPYWRTRSDAEGLALEALYDAGVELPGVNLKIAGEEADLVWRGRRLIIEIDGPQFHQFRDEDARKARAWRQAGYTVRRISSDSIYDTPEELIDLCKEVAVGAVP
jgi:hypothetical protein